MNRRRPAPKTAARYAALALSAFLLSGPGLAADLIGRGKTTYDVIDGIVGGAQMRETSIDIVQHGGSMYIEDNHAIGGGDYAFGGALFATKSGLGLWTEGSIIVRSNDVTSDREARGGAMYANQRMIDSLGRPMDLMAMRLMASADVVLSGNRAVSSGDYAQGGAVYAQTGAEITAGGKVILSGNTADGSGAYGGAVYANKADIAVSGASVLLNDNTAQGSNRALGGALYASEGNVKLTGGRIEVVRNKAAATGNNAWAEGGALYAEGVFDPAVSTSDSAPMTLSADTTIDISGNRAEAGNNAKGGALYAGDGALITAGGEVRLSGNTASGKEAWGGAVYGRYNGITVRGAAVTLSGNIATGIDWAFGGAVFAMNDITISGDSLTVQSNDATSEGGPAEGGAVYSRYGATLTGNTLTVQSNDVTSTGGIAQGGAVYAVRAVKLEGASSVIVRNNKARGATAEGGALRSCLAGGVFLTSLGGSITVQSNDAFASAASARGGAIFISDAEGELAEGAAVTLSADGDVLVSGNTVNSKTDTAGPVYIIAQGGAIWSTVGVSLASAGGAVTVENNSAAAAPCDDTNFDETGGGAVWSASDIALSGVSVDVRRNRVQNGNTDVRGGALYSQSGTVALTASGGAVTVQSNDAVHTGRMSASGGAVWAGGSVTIAGSEVAVLGNSATAENARAEGGAVYAEKADIAVRGASVTLSGNTAKGSAVALGGALLASEGNVKLTGGRIEAVRNKAAAGTSWAAGGAVCADNDIRISGDTVSVQSNDAASEGGSAYGGALYTVAGSVTIAGDEVEVSANTVSAHKSGFGGAIHGEGSVKVSGGSLVFKDNAVSAAYGTGGAIYTAKSVDMQGGAISLADNSVRAVSANYATPDGRGGAIKAGTTALLSADTVGLSRNSVTASHDGFGGAIDADSGVTVTGSAIALIGNTVTAGTEGYGGAIYASGDVTITGGAAELRENRVTADSDAGGGAVEAGNITMTVASLLAEGNAVRGEHVRGGALNATERLTVTAAGDIVLRGNRVEGIPAAGGSAIAANGIDEQNGTVGAGVTLTAAGKIEFAGNVAKVNLTAAELEQHVAAAGEQAALMREVLLVQFGGAVFAAGGVTLSADEVIFDGNRVENELGLNRGAVTTLLGSVDITARRVEFRTAGDSVVAGGHAEIYGMATHIAVPSVDIRVTGSMQAAAGTLFAAPSGTLTVRGGDLELYPAPGGTAADAAAVTTFAARAVDLGGARLELVGSLPLEKGVHRLDFAAVALPQNGAFTPPDISGYREGALLSRDIDISASGGDLALLADKGFAARMLTLQYTSSSLTWNGGDSGVWTVHGGAKGWTVDETGGRDDFYLGDDVTFGPNAAPETITLSGDIETAQMIVNGDYTFTGGDSLNVGVLTVTSGSSAFAREVTAKNAALSGAARLTLEGALKVTGAFTQGAGSTLIVDVNKLPMAALLGSGSATLKVESGAALQLKNDTAGASSTSYTIASGFKSVESVWADENVSGEARPAAGGDRVTYAVSSEGGNVSVTVTSVSDPAPTPAPGPAPTPAPKPDPTPAPVPEERSPFRLTAGQSLRSAAGVGAALQGRGYELLNAPVDILSYANGFLPLEKGKTGGVWAHTWYSRARVDNATADMTFKNYGVTLGADRQFGTGIAGLAINLGKTEGRGKGRFDGSDSDGKHIGISLYGARPIAGGNVTLTGDIGYHWHSDDYDSTYDGDYYRARKAKSRVFTVGGTAWFNTGRPGAKCSLKPFVGVRYSRFSMDDFTAQKNGADWATLGGERVTQWTVPLGVKFDWSPVNTKRGWKVKPSAELAYVYAGGDRAMTLRQTTFSGGEAARSTQLLSDRNNFRASLGLEAKRKNMTLGLGVDALLSSGQKDVAVNATLRWDL